MNMLASFGNFVLYQLLCIDWNTLNATPEAGIKILTLVKQLSFESFLVEPLRMLFRPGRVAATQRWSKTDQAGEEPTRISIDSRLILIAKINVPAIYFNS